MLKKSFATYCTWLYCFVFALLISCPAKAQLPVNGAGIIYLKDIQSNNIIAYDPLLPMSAGNPAINTIQCPANSHGLAISEALGTGNGTLTFYTVVDGIYWYYDPGTATWISTNQTNNPAQIGANIGGGGGFMYHLAWGTPPAVNIEGSVYKYDGSGNGAYLLTLPNFNAFTTQADLAVDCAGNFFVFSLSDAFLRKYNPNGNLIQEWTVNNPNNYNTGTSLPGFAIVDNKLYLQIQAPGAIYHITYGTIGATSVDFTQPLLPISNNLHGEDFASTPFAATPNLRISTADTILCPNALATFTAIAGGTGQTGLLQWFVNAVPVPGQTNATFTFPPNDGDMITCVAEVAASDCFLAGSISSNTITIHIVEPAEPTLTYEPFVFCAGDAVTAQPEFTPTGGTFTATGLQIDPDNGTIAMGNYTPGLYYVTYSPRTVPGCEQKGATDTIVINPRPEAGITGFMNSDVCLNDTFALYAQAVPGYVYEWSPVNYFPNGNTNAHTIAKVRESGIVSLSVTNKFGCSNKDSLFLNARPCCNLFVPNAFSPNGDGNNEYFLSQSAVTQKILQFSIYNRWGERVFHSYNQNEGWNGLHHQKPADPGIYFYYVHYECADGNLYVKKGDLTLIR